MTSASGAGKDELTAVDGGRAAEGVSAGEGKGAAVVFVQGAGATDDTGEGLIGGAVVGKGAVVDNIPGTRAATTVYTT